MLAAKTVFERDLWEKVAKLNPETGERTVKMLLDKADETAFAVEVSDLMSIPNARRPSNILGKERMNPPEALTMLNMDKWWQILGDQYAVFAREPIFFANYLDARKMLAPLEAQLTKQFGSDIAKSKLAKMATDRAYEVTLAYTDNPLNRTMLAWNSRNLARYYRATEDFARRMLRVGKNYPVGFWKVALTYDALEDTGFVWSDERDEKFFVFPGSDSLMKVIDGVFSVLPGDIRLMQFDNADLELRGMVRMIAPSTDPKQSIPTFSSPVAAVLIKPMMNMFPALQSFEQALLGEYAEGKSLWDSILLGHVLRAMALK